MKTSKVYSISDDEFEALIKNSKSYSECLRGLGLSTRGGTSSKRLKKRIAELGLSTAHFESGVSFAVKSIKRPLEDILVENSTYLSTSHLKQRLLNEGLLTNECAICGNKGEWLGKKLVLQLDHKDGFRTNNKLSNLRLLCPNCHAQTETYCKGASNSSQNKKNYSTSLCHNCNKEFCRKEENQKFCSVQCVGAHSRQTPPVSKSKLVQLLKDHSFVFVGKMYDVSDNTVRKWCVKYSISTKAKDYK